MSKLKSLKEMSNVFRKYGTPIGPLEEPLHLSMDGRRVGTSLNNIIRQRNMKLFTVEDAIRQRERKKLENHVMNPLQTNAIQNEVTQNEVNKNEVNKNEVRLANHKPKRPEPKRLSDKKLIKKNTTSLKRPEPKRVKGSRPKRPDVNHRMTKKGGQIVHYKTNRWHHRWKPLRMHHMDCGPNCFYVLKYADYDTCVEMARRKKKGIGEFLILELLDEAYGQGHEWREISQLGYSHEYLNDTFLDRDGDEDYAVTEYFINTYLEQNEATFASIYYGGKLHFFVLLRDERGFFAIDAQSGEVYPLQEYMDYYSEGNETAKLQIVDSKLHSREPYKVTMSMVKRYFPFLGEIKKAEKKHESRMRQSERASMRRANRESRTQKNNSISK